MYPNAAHASHRDCMIPRSWNDFKARPFASISTSLVEPATGDGAEDGFGEDSLADFDAVGFVCVDVVGFTLFDGVLSSSCKVPSAFLFLIDDMLSICEDAHIFRYRTCSPAGLCEKSRGGCQGFFWRDKSYNFFVPTRNIQIAVLVLSIRAAELLSEVLRKCCEQNTPSPAQVQLCSNCHTFRYGTTTYKEAHACGGPQWTPKWSYRKLISYQRAKEHGHKNWGRRNWTKSQPASQRCPFNDGARYGKSSEREAFKQTTRLYCYVWSLRCISSPTLLPLYHRKYKSPPCTHTSRTYTPFSGRAVRAL